MLVEFITPCILYILRWEGKTICFVGRRCILVSTFQAEAQKKKDEAEVQVN